MIPTRHTKGIFSFLSYFLHVYDIFNAVHVRKFFCNYAAQGYPMYAYSHSKEEERYQR